jgi:hypothetical protein
MLKIEDPGSSFLLYLGPGPPSLLHLTRANAAKPYSGDTLDIQKDVRIKLVTKIKKPSLN